METQSVPTPNEPGGLPLRNADQARQPSICHPLDTRPPKEATPKRVVKVYALCVRCGCMTFCPSGNKATVHSKTCHNTLRILLTCKQRTSEAWSAAAGDRGRAEMKYRRLLMDRVIYTAIP